MRKNKCELIRRELDELMLHEAYSSTAVEHLRECAECREFQDKQTKLRQIVGSLGTVSAPPDFDFRLRARLANEAGAASQFHYGALARRGFAVAAMVIVFATAGVLVRNVIYQPATTDQTASREEPKVLPPAPGPVETRAPILTGNSDQNIVTAAGPDKHPQVVKNERPLTASYKSKRAVVAVDFSSQRADVINNMETVGKSASFPIDAASQPFKVSLDDGRGNARTISVPTISFGSQRIMQSANQYAPKRVW